MFIMGKQQNLQVWVFQTGEPLQIDGENIRPMRAMNLSNKLIEAGHQVILWSSSFYHQEKRHRSKKAEVIKFSEKLEIRLIPSLGYKRNIGPGRLIDHAQMAINLKKMLRSISVKDYPDIVFIGYPPIETAAVLSKWCKNNNIPTIIDIKDQWPQIFIDPLPAPLKPLGRLALWPYFYLARRAMRDASGISVMADSFLDWSLKFVGRPRKESDTVFPLTTPVESLSRDQLSNAGKWWDSIGVKDDKSPKLCFVGSHSNAFNFKPVYDAAERLYSEGAKCEFIICGAGEKTVELKKMMSNLPNVIFPGWIDRPRIESLAKRCIAGLVPYHNTEDFQMSIPNKVIDYLSLGLPVLSSLDGEVAKLIDKNKVGFKYDDNISLFECIKKLIENPEINKTISKNAFDTYQKHFSFEKVYGNLVKHIEKMTNEEFS